MSFRVIILEKDVSCTDELDKLEMHHISRLGCINPNGYNYMIGGQTQNRFGIKYSIEIRDKMAKERSGGRVYRLLNNKTGVIHEFQNINRFADDNNISGPMLSVILSRKKSKKGDGTSPYYSQHQEWTLPETPLQKILCISPDGGEEIVLSGVDGGVKGFCKRQGFPSTSNVFKTIRGEFSQAYGWTFKIL